MKKKNLIGHWMYCTVCCVPALQIYQSNPQYSEETKFAEQPMAVHYDFTTSNPIHQSTNNTPQRSGETNSQPRIPLAHRFEQSWIIQFDLEMFG